MTGKSASLHGRLSRRDLHDAGIELPVAPVRIVHFGVGAFHRAHQAWYTAKATDAQDWGIAAFTGRSADMADRLAPQDGVYTLIERGPEGDEHELIGSLSSVIAGDDSRAVLAALSAPTTAIVTFTITEAGYRLTPSGEPDLDDPAVRSDLESLTVLSDENSALETARAETVLGRLLIGLEARRRNGAPPLALVPCDNLPDNGGHLARGIRSLAVATSPALAAWLDRGVSFVSTSVDRITPSVGEREVREIAELTGWEDAAPVVTEPFSSWVLSGEFPSGRPAWEAAGAQFVDDIEPYELRKLWMLNGAHSLLAYSGLLRGLRTVAEAISDPECRADVERLWDEDRRQLPESADTAAYRVALLERFGNARIEHRLEQIATDGLMKLRLRIAPVAQRELAEGRSAEGCAVVIAAWVSATLRGIPLADAAAVSIRRAVTESEPRVALLALVDPALADNPGFRALVEAAAQP